MQRKAAKKAGNVNRRRFERLAIDRPVTVTEFDDFGTPSATWSARLVDLSRGGLGLRSRRMVHAGRSIAVEVFGAPGDRPRLLFGAVRQSRYSQGEGYAVGIEFCEIPQSPGIKTFLRSRGYPVPDARRTA